MVRDRLKRLTRSIVLPFILVMPLGASAADESIPHPVLQDLEPAVAEQIGDLRTRIEQPGDADTVTRAIHYAELGALYHSLQFSEAALACYLNAEALAPTDGRWSYLQGVLHTDQGDVLAARHALLRAMALQPELQTGWVRLGRLALDDGDPGSAWLHYQRALASLPDSAAALAGAGQALLELDRAREAVDFLERALEIEPRANRLNYPLAMAYRDLGDKTKMETHLEKVGPIGVTVDDPIAEYATARTAGARVHIQRGNKAYRAGDYAAAVKHFTRATEAAPNQASPWTNLGAAQGGMGDLQAAQRSFERALEITPDNTTALENLVAVLMSRDEESAALNLLNDKLDADSGNRNLLYRRAELRRLNGDPEGAAEDFRRLTQLLPEEAPAWMGLIISRIEAGDHEAVPDLLGEAGESLDQLPELKGELVEALLAIYDGNADDAALARRLAKELYEQQPLSTNATRVARVLLLGRDDCSAANQWLDSQMRDDAIDDKSRGDLNTIQEQLQGMDRCQAPEASDED